MQCSSYSYDSGIPLDSINSQVLVLQLTWRSSGTSLELGSQLCKESRVHVTSAVQWSWLQGVPSPYHQCCAVTGKLVKSQRCREECCTSRVPDLWQTSERLRSYGPCNVWPCFLQFACLRFGMGSPPRSWTNRGPSWVGATRRLCGPGTKSGGLAQLGWAIGANRPPRARD
jgi:hypothetical protein